MGRTDARGLRVLAEAATGISLTRHGTGVPQLDPTAHRRVSTSGIEPLAEAGKIGALLAQFPASFKQSPESQAYLDALLARFQDYPMAVELRHRSWSDGFGDTLSLLNAQEAPR